MACDCNKKDYGCSGMPISSNCTYYEGPSIPLFGICTGDPITYVTKAITDKILELTADEDIDLSSINVDNCLILKEKLGVKDKTYANLIQVLWDYGCTLNQLIVGLQAEVDALKSTPYAFDLKCITPVGTPVNIDAIVQGIINKVCALETQVNNIAPNVQVIVNEAAGTFLGQAITANGNRGFIKTGSGSTTKINFTALVPPLSLVAYIGPASNFNSDGSGLVGSAYEGWYFIDGQDGRLDARGRVLVPAVLDVPGGTLDPAVDPTQPYNPDTSYKLGDKKGENYHKLTVAELPSIQPTINDIGHSHGTLIPVKATNSDDGGQPDYVAVTNGQTSVATTGITINPFGGGDIHNIRQPLLVITGWIYRKD